MKIQDIIDLMAQSLGDPDLIQYTLPDVLRAINEGLSWVLGFKPSAFAFTDSVLLVAGVKQSLPAGGERLLGVDYNMGSDGVTQGRAIRIVTREHKQSLDPDWALAEAGTLVKQLIYANDQDPKIYYVFPPVVATPAVYVQISYTKPPAEITAGADDFPIDITYRGAVREAALYILFNRDAPGTENYTRGQNHYQKALQMLGAIQLVDDQLDEDLKQ